WGTTPRRLRMRGPSASGSMSRTRSVPSVTGETQPIMRMVELFPAPLGPRNPNASPRPTSKSTASTAVNDPNRLVSPRAKMSASSGATAPDTTRALLGGQRHAHANAGEARLDGGVVGLHDAALELLEVVAGPLEVDLTRDVGQGGQDDHMVVAHLDEATVPGRRPPLAVGPLESDRGHVARPQ